MEGTHEVGRRPFMPDSTLNRRSVALYVAKPTQNKLSTEDSGVPVDPWGYKGLSLKLINSVLQNWGCDCVFFFNYNRINMGLNNELVKEHMNALFGRNRAEALRAKLEKLSGDQREVTIIEELSDALREMGGNYVLPFRFRNAT